MTNSTIVRIIREIGFRHKHPLNPQELLPVEMNVRSYTQADIPEFERDLIEAGNTSRILFLKKTIPIASFAAFLLEQQGPVVTYLIDNAAITPVLWQNEKGKLEGRVVDGNLKQTIAWSEADGKRLLRNDRDEIMCLTSVMYDSPLTSPGDGPLSPVRRLTKLLVAERKEILYVFIYGLLVGLVSLALPLGIQTTVELISGGVFFSSVYVMIGLVILGVLAGGALQIMQITMVEHLQRRVFAKAAFEFGYRIPRLRMEALTEKYAPELINRFFDVMNLQKGLPKLLIDFSSSAIQILFGLFLISLYHPFFIFFGLLLIGVLATILLATGRVGLRSSIEESKYKYRVAHWLEELGRAIQSFKLGGTTDLPMRKTDYNVNGYLQHREVHFKTLIAQFSFIVLFKAAAVGGLLIVGTLLVVQREITLGQLVASEIVIVLIIASVERLITYMDVVYDLLTAVDKIGHVTDLPLERSGGIDLNPGDERGLAIDVRQLSYAYPNGRFRLHDINLAIAAGERICISGPGGSGKTTLTSILAGLYVNYEGSVTMDGYSLRDLDLSHLRERIAKNISVQDLFDGTLFENLSVGNPRTSAGRIMAALQTVGIADKVNAMPNGLSTHLLSGGMGLSDTVIQKLILSRCIAKQPKLMVLQDLFMGFTRSEKLVLIQKITDPANPWTLVTVSNDPLVMAACDRVVVLDQGSIKAVGPFAELIKQDQISSLID